MNKAIIITRSSEYSGYVDFKKAIEKSEGCEYNNNNNLMKFLAARKAWKDIRNDCDSDTEAYEKFLGKEPSLDIPTEDIMYKAIKKKMETITPDESIIPYASFHVGQEWEVILVLCDRIGIERKDCVNPVDLFLECICEDLQLFDTTDNVLYIHAEQIGFWQDGILVDNKELIGNSEKSENRVFKWIKQKKSTFKRIGYFVHEPRENGIFERNIRQTDFLGKNKIIDYLEAKKKKS